MKLGTELIIKVWNQEKFGSIRFGTSSIRTYESFRPTLDSFDDMEVTSINVIDQSDLHSLDIELDTFTVSFDMLQDAGLPPLHRSMSSNFNSSVDQFDIPLNNSFSFQRNRPTTDSTSPLSPIHESADWQQEPTSPRSTKSRISSPSNHLHGNPRRCNHSSSKSSQNRVQLL